MAAKIIFVLCVAVLSVAFSMPSAKPFEEGPNDNMQTAETSHSHVALPSFYNGIRGYPPYPMMEREGINIGTGFGGNGNYHYQYNHAPQNPLQSPFQIPGYPNF